MRGNRSEPLKFRAAFEVRTISPSRTSYEPFKKVVPIQSCHSHPLMHSRIEANYFRPQRQEPITARKLPSLASANGQRDVECLSVVRKSAVASDTIQGGMIMT